MGPFEIVILIIVLILILVALYSPPPPQPTVPALNVQSLNSLLLTILLVIVVIIAVIWMMRQTGMLTRLGLISAASISEPCTLQVNRRVPIDELVKLEILWPADKHPPRQLPCSQLQLLLNTKFDSLR